MRAYIIRRLLLMIPTFFLVTAFVFLLVRFIPGSVIDLMMSEMATQGVGTGSTKVDVEIIKQRLGLDVPIYTQYGRWLGVAPSPNIGFSGILQGNLGKSLWMEWPIGQEILAKLPVSLELGALALLIAILIGLPIGIFSAIRQDTKGDYAGRTFAILAISVPSFWIGTLVIVWPSIWWGYMPSLRYIHLLDDPLGNLQQFIVPAFILGLVTCGTKMRMTRTMMLEVLRQDYIRTAWSKGLSERVIILRHALKNALIPVVTIVGLQVPLLIGGAVVMESIFVLPGMGRYLLQAIQQRDYPIVSAINVVLASFILVLNLVIDLTYAWLDPRVQYK